MTTPNHNPLHGTTVRAAGRRTSPHVLDLATPTSGVGADRPRKMPAKWRRLLDERIHLQDLRVRSVSVRARGWKDFPPTTARTLGHATWLTVVRFFDGHPLAELTVLSLVQTVAVLAWRLLLRPAEMAVLGTRGDKDLDTAIAAPTLLPVMPAPERVRWQQAPKPRPAAGLAEVKEAFRLPRFSLAFERPAGWYRGVAGFGALAMVLVLPLSAYSSFGSIVADKDAAIAKTLAAVSSLRSAGGAVSSQDFDAAHDAFAMAERDFESARDELGAIAAVLSAAGAVAPSHPFSSAGNLLAAGEEIAKGGERVAAGLSAIEGDFTPAERIRILGEHLDAAMPHLDRALIAIDKTSPRGVPEKYRPTLATAKEELPPLVSGLREAAEVSRFLAAMLGADGPKRYLMVFQNNTEVRATGGFIGSFALVDVDKGTVRSVDIPGGGSYDLKGSLRAALVSPQPLHLINPHWQFQDANWSPDFPESAERLAWFYGKSGGPTVDGVIAVNAGLMAKLLGVIGDIEMAPYEVTVDEGNFIEATQKEVEIDYDREENRPKQFIADLAPKVIDRLYGADKDTFLGLVGILDEGLSVRDIQMWFRDPEMQRQASGFGWTGEMKSGSGDYLQVVHTNIAGQKTDGVMNEEITHEAKVLPDGETIVTLTVVRTHGGTKGAPFTGVRNVDYLRVYVPYGSALVESRGFTPPDPKLFKFPEEGFERDPVIAERERQAKTDARTGTRTMTENGKTVFANWVQTDPGETSVVTLVYKLPPGTITMRHDDGGILASLTGDGGGIRGTYALLVQKQSGTRPARFVSRVDFPRGYHAVWSGPERTTDGRGSLVSETTLDRDAFFGIVAESP